jgi:hypothetical protein
VDVGRIGAALLLLASLLGTRQALLRGLKACLDHRYPPPFGVDPRCGRTQTLYFADTGEEFCLDVCLTGLDCSSGVKCEGSPVLGGRGDYFPRWTCEELHPIP